MTTIQFIEQLEMLENDWVTNNASMSVLQCRDELHRAVTDFKRSTQAESRGMAEPSDNRTIEQKLIDSESERSQLWKRKGELEEQRDMLSEKAELLEDQKKALAADFENMRGLREEAEKRLEVQKEQAARESAGLVKTAGHWRRNFQDLATAAVTKRVVVRNELGHITGVL